MVALAPSGGDQSMPCNPHASLPANAVYHPVSLAQYSVHHESGSGRCRTVVCTGKAYLFVSLRRKFPTISSEPHVTFAVIRTPCRAREAYVC